MRLKTLLAAAITLLLTAPAIANADADRQTLKALIAGAIAEGRQHLRIPPGVYRLAPPLEIAGASGLTIDAEGCTLVFTDFLSNGLVLSECVGLAIKGLTIDYDPLPFTQGTVSEVNADGTEARVQLHAGYPRLAGEYVVGRMHIFDSETRLLKMDVGDVYGQMVPDGDGNGCAFMLSTPQPHLAPGDLAVFDTRRRCAIYITGMSRNCVFEDVTILTAPGIGVLARFSLGGDTFRRLVIKRGPRPEGASEERLFSTCADGLNYAYVREGIIMEDCDFSFMGDDSVNFHGPALPVAKVDEDGTIWTVRPHGEERFGLVARSGDEVILIGAGNFAVEGRGELESLVAEPSPAWATREMLAEFFPVVAGRQNWEFRATGYAIRLKEPVLASPGCFVDISSLAAQNFVIRDCYFHDHRARGLRIMSRKGVIENNRFERIRGSAISLGPEYSQWRESGWPEDIIVRGNVLTDTAVGYGEVRPASYSLGAISLFSRRDDTALPVYPGSRNITIVNNTIIGSGVAGIYINSAAECLVSGNVISKTLQRDVSRAGQQYGLSVTGPITVENSRDIRIEENTVE